MARFVAEYVWLRDANGQQMGAEYPKTLVELEDHQAPCLPRAGDQIELADYNNTFTVWGVTHQIAHDTHRAVIYLQG